MGYVEKMIHELLSAFAKDRETLKMQKDTLARKMEALAAFASLIVRFPCILKQCVLLHLSDLENVEKLYKQWISEQEATIAHQMMEACRDAICEEKVTRKLRNSIQSDTASDASWAVLHDRDRVQLLLGRNDDVSST